MIKVLSIVFTFLLLSGCQKEDSMAELLIGKWCLAEESINYDWIKSDKYIITFSKNGNISIFNTESQEKCESTYKLDESSLMIDSPQNCARYKLESVDEFQLILYNQGRSEVYRYKFKRC